MTKVMSGVVVGVGLLVCHTGAQRAAAPAATRTLNVIGYYADWTAGRYPLADIPAAGLTHVNYAFGKIGPDNHLTVNAAAALERVYPGDCSEPGCPHGLFHQITLLKQKHPHLKFIMSVGGWTDSAPFYEMAATDASRQAFAQSCAEFLKMYPQFDGIDIDWEHPVIGGLQPGQPRDARHYVLLLTDLRRAIGPDKLLTVAVSASPRGIAPLEYVEMSASLDWVSVMTYDFHSGGNRAGHNSPLYNHDDPSNPKYNLHDAVEGLLEKGVPPTKLVAGVPFYGRGWNGVESSSVWNSATGAGQAGGYTTIVERYLNGTGYVRYWDDVAKVPWLYNAEAKHWITYDDPQSMRLKGEYIAGRKLGGAMFWELSTDDGSLLDALRAGLGTPGPRPVQEMPYDLVITGGSVINGDGTPAVTADIGVRAGKIATLGNTRSLRAAPARQRIDASGLTVAPGFIDMHNHSDYTILVEPKSESMIRQGVTTMVLGESRSAGPVKAGINDDPRAGSDGATVDWTTLGGYFDRLERQHMATNIASYVGEEQVWAYVKGYGQSPATPAELDAMKQLVAQAMQEGAMGLSTALLQPPSSLATTANLIELAKVAKQYGGIYSSHIRDEGEGVFRAIDEAIQVGKDANIPVDILHMKIAHKKLWGRANEIIAMVQKARDAGYNIQANVYPYTAGQNNLSSIIPPWAHDGGREKMLQRLRDPVARRRMHDEILKGLPNWYNHYLATGDGWAGMLLVSLNADRNKPFQGRRMSELIKARGGDPVNVLFDVLVEEGGSVPAVFFHHSEPDMQLVLKQPWTSIGSDGTAVNPDGPTGRSHPHPRYYGTFPRVLGRYVRELKVLTLPEAIKKMTSMNADKVGIKDRGRLRDGLWADITIFDPGRVIDRATYENPHQFPVGIEYVIVNGIVTVDHERHTGALAGRVLYGPGKK